MKEGRSHNLQHSAHISAIKTGCVKSAGIRSERKTRRGTRMPAWQMEGQRSFARQRHTLQHNISSKVAYMVEALNTSRKVARSNPNEVIFSIYLILPAALWTWGCVSPNRIFLKSHFICNVLVHSANCVKDVYSGM
jgi:hypothetical protein